MRESYMMKSKTKTYRREDMVCVKEERKGERNRRAGQKTCKQACAKRN